MRTSQPKEVQHCLSPRLRIALQANQPRPVPQLILEINSSRVPRRGTGDKGTALYAALAIMRSTGFQSARCFMLATQTMQHAWRVRLKHAG